MFFDLIIGDKMTLLVIDINHRTTTIHSRRALLWILPREKQEQEELGESSVL